MRLLFLYHFVQCTMLYHFVPLHIISYIISYHITSYINTSYHYETVNITSYHASQTSEARRHIKIEHFVAIAGAYHPQLYSESAPRFRESSTCIIVQHYQKDKLCLWEPVRAVWERMRDRHASNVYINDLDFSSSPLINPNYHDTEKFLLTQKDFWNEFQLFEPHGFEGRCTTASLGRNQEALEELRQVGYDSLSGRLQYSRNDSHSNVQRCFCDTCERSWLCAGRMCPLCR